MMCGIFKRGVLLKDLKTLEEVDVYIEAFGDRDKGTVFSVAADNLAAHALAGFNENFRSTYFCRFCLTTQTEMQPVYTCDYQIKVILVIGVFVSLCSSTTNSIGSPMKTCHLPFFLRWINTHHSF